MQKIHTTHLFLKLCSTYHFEAIMFGPLFDEAAVKKRKILSHVRPVRSTLAYRVMHQAEVVHAGPVLSPVVFLTLCSNKSVQRSALRADSKAPFAWNCNLHPSILCIPVFSAPTMLKNTDALFTLALAAQPLMTRLGSLLSFACFCWSLVFGERKKHLFFRHNNSKPAVIVLLYFSGTHLNSKCRILPERKQKLC